jgi:hypothetical protein
MRNPRRQITSCVTGEDEVARLGLIVAGEAGFHERLVGKRFAVLEVSETPTASCGSQLAGAYSVLPGVPEPSLPLA